MAHGPHSSEHFEQYTLKNIFSLPLGNFTTKIIAELTKILFLVQELAGHHDPLIRYSCCSITIFGTLQADGQAHLDDSVLNWPIFL